MKARHRTGAKILFAPEALDRLVSGFDHLAALIAMTLGPRQAPVLNAREDGSVEVLADAGTIARRVVAIPDRGRNTGAMVLRNLAWQMHEEFGDGAATAAVLARAMVREAVKRIEAEIDPVLIRGGMELALPVALAALAEQAEPVSRPEVLAAIATGITGDADLGAVLGEMVDVLGPGAALTFEEFSIPTLDRQYIEGTYWRAHPAARTMIPEGQSEVVLEHPLIMLADQDLTEVDDIRRALELAARSADCQPLLLVPSKLGERALNTVSVNQARGTVTAIAAILGTLGPAHTDDLSDMAVLTGATVLSDMVGRPPGRLRLADLGTARRVIVKRDSLTIVGGAGDPAIVAERTIELQWQANHLAGNEAERKQLQGRISRLGGGIGVLKLGARIGTDLAHRRAQAEKAFRVLTGMLADGVVPGGGVAYLECVAAVQAVRSTCPVPGQEHGVDVLLSSLDAPFRQIVRNHGLVHPPIALDEVRRCGCGHGLDVLTGEYVEMRKRGILDSFLVTHGALQTATSAAMMVLTTGVMVLPPASKQAVRARP